MSEKTNAPTSLRLTEEDKIAIEKARRILGHKGIKVTLVDALRASLYFFVEQKEAEKSDKPTPK